VTGEQQALILLIDEAKRTADLLESERSRWRTEVYRLNARLGQLERKLTADPGHASSTKSLKTSSTVERPR
jgi:hypothetical protein